LEDPAAPAPLILARPRRGSSRGGRVTVAVGGGLAGIRGLHPARSRRT
jgi:hypothetical protein